MEKNIWGKTVCELIGQSVNSAGPDLRRVVQTFAGPNPTIFLSYQCHTQSTLYYTNCLRTTVLLSILVLHTSQKRFMKTGYGLKIKRDQTQPVNMTKEDFHPIICIYSDNLYLLEFVLITFLMKLHNIIF